MSIPGERDSPADGEPADAPPIDRLPGPLSDPTTVMAPQSLALGRRIIEELGSEDAPRLSRWIAYRIAELIHAAEAAAEPDARREAERACTELVLRVWRERSAWPSGWPPPAASEILESLRKRTLWRRADLPDAEESHTWTNTLSAAIESLDRERALWTLAALSEQDPDELASWLGQDGATLSEEEKETLTAVHEAASRAPLDLAAALRRASDPRGHQLRDSSSAHQMGKILQELQDAAETRFNLAKQIATSPAASQDLGDGPSEA